MKIRIKKSFTVGLALCMVLLLLGGCASKQTAEEPVASDSVSETTPAAEDTASSDGENVEPKVEWVSKYNGPDSDDDRMFGVIELSDGGYIAVGNSENEDESETAFYLKYAADGTQEWVMQILIHICKQ